MLGIVAVGYAIVWGLCIILCALLLAVGYAIRELGSYLAGVGYLTMDGLSWFGNFLDRKINNKESNE